MAFMTLGTMESPRPPPLHSHPPALPAGRMEMGMSELACGTVQHPAAEAQCLSTINKSDVTAGEAVSILKWDRKQGRGSLGKANELTGTHM